MAMSCNHKPSYYMDYEQYLMEPSCESRHIKYRVDADGSLLRSFLSAPPIPLDRKIPPPVKLHTFCMPDNDQEWTHATQVPLDAYCRIKWTWTESVQEDQNSLLIFDDPQFGTRSLIIQPHRPDVKFASFETIAAMGDRPLRKNALSYWEVEVSSHLLRSATSLMVGVGTKFAKRRSVGYLNIVGADQHSWGLSNNGQLWHNNQSIVHCKPLASYDQAKIVIGLLYNGFNGQLSFSLNGTITGQAFKGIGQHERLYPMISSTALNSHFKMGPVFESMPSLQDLCRERIIASLSPSSWNQQILPKSVVDFLN